MKKYIINIQDIPIIEPPAGIWKNIKENIKNIKKNNILIFSIPTPLWAAASIILLINFTLIFGSLNIDTNSLQDTSKDIFTLDIYDITSDSEIFF